KCWFVEDGSYIWDRDNDYDTTIGMATTLFQYLEKKITENEEQRIDELLNIVKDNFQVAFFWRRLLLLASKYPAVFAHKIYDLTIAYPLQTYPETMRDLVKFLKVAIDCNAYNSEEIARIEKSIVDIKPGQEGENVAFYQSCQARLLSQLPMDRLSLDQSKTILQQAKIEAIENKPLVEFFSSKEPYTEEKWLKEQGVDLVQQFNKKILDLSNPLKAFSEKYLNKTPTLLDIQNVMGTAIEVKNKLYDTDEDIQNADQHVINSAWRHLSVFAETLCKCNEISSSPDSSEYQFCKMVLLRAAQHNDPEPNSKYDDEYSSPGWSPAPRNSAAIGLPLLLNNYADQEIFDAVKKLARDQVPSVRFLTMTRINFVKNNFPDQYWLLMKDVSKTEGNRVVLNAFINSVFYWVNINESNVVETVTNIDKQMLYDEPRSNESYIRLLAHLLVESGNEWAILELNRLLTDPLAYGKALDRLAFELMVFLDVKRWKSGADIEKIKNVKNLIESIIKVVTNELEKTLDDQATPDDTKKKQYQALYAVIHEIVSRTYFNSGFSHPDDISLVKVKEVYFNNVAPLLDQVLIFALSGKGILGASTAHYFMQFLNAFLEVNPAKVLEMASKLAKGSQYWNYHLDSMGIREVVSLTEKLLADHKDLLQNDQSLSDLLNMLDVFVTAGWPEAVNLIWRLDEVFR
ncbi:MAG: hypothetical protein HQ517_03520, partial [SAR324 cluster bacterium]|nr:hypothetical protein [SAR324 cluster bacterium]